MNKQDAFNKQIAAFNQIKSKAANRVQLDFKDCGVYIACINKIDQGLMGKSNVIKVKLDVGLLASNSGKPTRQISETFQKFYDLGLVTDYSAEFEGNNLIATVDFKDFNSKQYNSVAQSAAAYAVANNKQRLAQNSANAKAINSHYKNN